MLRSVPQKLIGVLVLFGAIATLFFVPWLDTSKVRSARFRPMLKPFFWAFAVDCVLLGYCGSQSVDAAWNLGGILVPLIWVARLGTIYYYAYFWLALPLIGLVEHPLALPDSIARPVLGPGTASLSPAE
jgi:ubiquinol-cytochrome c reductase cytochrome b subunit